MIEVENRAHCEFPNLRDLLIKTHMEDMIEVTKNIHYENYRRTKLTEKMAATTTTTTATLAPPMVNGDVKMEATVSA